MSDFRPRPIQIDVGRIVKRSVTTLYSHLVTRPTGRAVRLAIEAQLGEAGGEKEETAFSLIDLSEVTVLDFSCADEVVAKLLARYLPGDRPRDAFFVLSGVQEVHRDPIEVVLERQGLAAVVQGEDTGFELVGAHTGREGAVWQSLEAQGRVVAGEVDSLFPGSPDQEALESLVTRRLVFRAPGSGAIHALSRMVVDLV